MSTSGGQSGGGLSAATAHLTAAQISTLFSVPVPIVQGGGIGTLIIVVDVIYETVAGNSTWDAEDSGLYYSGDVSSGEAIEANLGSISMLAGDGAFDQIMTATPQGFVAYDTATVGQQAVVVSMVTANPVRSAPIATSSLAAGGAGYVAGDTGTVDDPVYGTHAAYIVDTVGALGIVLTYHLTAPGGAYDPTGSPYDTTAAGAQPGIGTGLTINVLTLAAATGDLYVTAFYKTIATH